MRSWMTFTVETRARCETRPRRDRGDRRVDSVGCCSRASDDARTRRRETRAKGTMRVNVGEGGEETRRAGKGGADARARRRYVGRRGRERPVVVARLRSRATVRGCR